jgi:hypothetical protein
MYFNGVTKTSKSILFVLPFFLLLSFSSIFAQNSDTDSLLINSFKEYTQLPRELVYAHLNKSVYIKGETIAFKAYVFDKDNKKLTRLTTNLYCSISDEKGGIIQSELVLVNEGVADGSFFVDSLFTSGNYVFKAYTNWMKNFDEQNFYLQNIKVIDPEIESNVVPKVISSKLDVQFLPEGGHLLADTENTVGVVIKDELGFGVPNLECQLISDDDEAINFKTNQFGISKFSFVPDGAKQYKVSINFGGVEQIFNVDTAELSGLTMTLSDLYNKVVIRISTNKSTLRLIQNQSYKLTIHNGAEMKSSNFKFSDDPELTRYINYDDLFSGINVFTVFNENNKPLLERLFFNHDGINVIQTDKIEYTKLADSTMVSVNFKDVDVDVFNNFSISVLPEETKAYNHHNNIISSTYLQPYLRGFIENASYYFTDINRRKQYELDNLLLTQGWSSYDWNRVFYNSPKPTFEFERGISLKAIDNYSKSSRFVMFPTAFNDLEIFETSHENNTFQKAGLFPIDDEKITFSELDTKDQVKKSRLYLQFHPSNIPDIEKYTKILPLKESVIYDSDLLQPILSNSWEAYEQLDEVLIEVNKTQNRIDKLQRSIYGNVDVFDDSRRRAHFDFASYIRTKGYIVSQMNGELIITRQGGAFRNRTPIVYIDNRLLLDTAELVFFDMDLVDYVIIDDSGFGEGFRGAGGVIKIVTDQTLAYKDNPEMATFQEIDVPLTFTSPKRFYVPKYGSYLSRFYNEYGVIQWFPKMQVDNNGRILFKIKSHGKSRLKFFIEGTANNGSFISETKTLQFE